MSEELGICRSTGSHSKAGPSVFYIFAPVRNPHLTLKFPFKCTTFHVTHTNPAAISLSLNRAESLYLNSLAQQCSAAAFGESSYQIVQRKKERKKEKKKKTTWPRPALLYAGFQQGSIWLYWTLPAYEMAPGRQQTTSHKKRIAHTGPQHVHKHTHMHTSTHRQLITQTPALPVCSQLPALLRVHLR